MLMELAIPLPSVTVQAHLEHIFRRAKIAQKKCVADSELEYLLAAVLDRAFSGGTSQ
jgi:hypothetical protein